MATHVAAHAVGVDQAEGAAEARLRRREARRRLGRGEGQDRLQRGRLGDCAPWPLPCAAVAVGCCSMRTLARAAATVTVGDGRRRCSRTAYASWDRPKRDSCRYSAYTSSTKGRLFARFSRSVDMQLDHTYKASMANVRIERDTFGHIEVPADRLWGAQTQRSLQNFKHLRRAHAARADPRAGAGQARRGRSVNLALGVLDAGEGRGHRRRRRRGASPASTTTSSRSSVWQTGSGTQTNMNMNEVLANRASRAARRRARRGAPRPPQRRRQQGPVVERRLPDGDERRRGAGAVSSTLLPARAASCATRSAAKSTAFAGIVKIGRTHLQDATPLTLGQEISRLGRAARPRHRARRGGAAAPVRAGARRHRGRHRAQRAPRVRRARRRRAGASSPGLPFVTAPNKFEALAAQRRASCTRTAR